MIMKVFSVFDAKAAFFGNPFYDQREGSAIRAFGDAVNKEDVNNGFYNHPEDYSLYMLGEFDNDTGAFDPIKPLCLVTASSMRTVGPVVQKELAVN